MSLPRALSRSHAGLLAIAIGLVASACGSGGAGGIAIGINRLALDISFAGDDPPEPISPNVIIQEIAVPSADLLAPTADLAAFERPTGTPPPAAPAEVSAEECGKAGAIASEPVTVTPRGTPRPGIYRYRNFGDVTVKTGATELTFPMPAESVWTVGNVVATEDPAAAPGLAGTTVVDYEVVKQIGPNLTIRERWRYDDTKLELVRRETTMRGRTTVFKPTSPLTHVEFEGEGASWADSGLDDDEQSASVLQGSISGRKVLQTCEGDAIDTFEVVNFERRVDVKNGFVGGNYDEDDTDAIWIAPHLGVLIVQQRHNYREIVTTDSGARAEITYTYSALLVSQHPGTGSAP